MGCWLKRISRSIIRISLAKTRAWILPTVRKSGARRGGSGGRRSWCGQPSGDGAEDRQFHSPAELEAVLLPLQDTGIDIFHASTWRFWRPEFADSDLTNKLVDQVYEMFPVY